MDTKRIETVTQRRSGMFDREAKNFFNEYFELTGEEFPPCDRSRWNSLDDWLTDLKLAVYREQAIREVYGDFRSSQGHENGASRAG